MTLDSLRTTLLDSTVELSRTVDFRAMLLDPSSEVMHESGGTVVFDRAIGLGIVHGRPPVSLLNSALANVPELISPEPFAGITEGWSWWPGVVMDLHDESALETWQRRASGVVVTMDAGLMERAPGTLKPLLRVASQRGSATCAVVDGRPVAFACVPLGTDTRYDLSVDTLKEYRCHGYARMVAAVLIGRERERGRQPLWGALESNAASIRAGLGLGFRVVDRLWVAQRG